MLQEITLLSVGESPWHMYPKSPQSSDTCCKMLIPWSSIQHTVTLTDWAKCLCKATEHKNRRDGGEVRRSSQATSSRPMISAGGICTSRGVLAQDCVIGHRGPANKNGKRVQIRGRLWIHRIFWWINQATSWDGPSRIISACIRGSGVLYKTFMVMGTVMMQSIVSRVTCIPPGRGRQGFDFRFQCHVESFSRASQVKHGTRTVQLMKQGITPAYRGKGWLHMIALGRGDLTLASG